MSETTPEYGDDLLALLGDEYVQAILALTSLGPMSASELGDEIDVDVSTIYRRVDDMLDHDLLVERTRIVEDGSHHNTYEANVGHVAIEVADGELTVGVERRESPAERFTRIWDDIRET